MTFKRRFNRFIDDMKDAVVIFLIWVVVFEYSLRHTVSIATKYTKLHS